MAIDSYMQVDGLQGESTDIDHKDWVDLLSFSQVISPPVSAIGSGTSGHFFLITKSLDSTSPTLYEMCSSGKHISKVTIELMRASGGARVKYMIIEMDQVVISKVTVASGNETPVESVSFDFGTIKWTYTQQRADGSAGGNVTGGWNVAENKAA